MIEKFSKYNPLLSAALLLAAIFLLIVVALMANQTAFPSQPQPAALVATVTPLPTATGTPLVSPTITPTARPTFTLAPTFTPTQTTTPTPTSTITPLPTLPAARPLRFNDLYVLRDWTAERADYTIRLMEGYPNARYRNDEARLTEEYNMAYTYAVFAQQEALLRFPEAEEAASWRWGLAYNLARLDDSTAGHHYAALIGEALNQYSIVPEALPAWFQEHETRMTLIEHPLPEADGNLRIFVVEIRTEGGGIYLIFREGEDGYQGSVLLSRFNFAGQIEPNLSIGDLTGDDYPEAVISFSPAPGDYILEEPEVWVLNEQPPASLSFAPSLPFDFGSEYRNEWIIATDTEGNNILQFIGTTFPACPVRITRSYEWDGSLFIFENSNFTINPIPELLGHCEEIITHSIHVWDAHFTARFLKTVLPSWPPAQDPNGRSYPAHAADEWRLRTAVFAGLAGERIEALEILQPLLENPTSNPWRRQAAEFAAEYMQPEDIYKACMETEICEPRAALRKVVQYIPLAQYSQLPAYLERFGVILRASGMFDFENDGEPERWLLVRHREGQKLELWVLARASEQIKALFVETVDTTNLALRYHEPIQEPPLVQIRPGVGFTLERVSGSLEPYLVHKTAAVVLTRYTEDIYAEIDQDFFVGANPEVVRSRMLELTEASRFNCRQFCDRFYYTLALTYELTGDVRAAIDQYIDLWWNYSASPYTHMARLKLDTLRTPTPPPAQGTTPTQPARTPTPMPYPGPGVTSTPFRTPTPLPYPYP
jgi:hypothetical protein